MKKITGLLLAFLMLCGFLAACGGQANTHKNGGADSLKIVTTIFPEYDWVREILGEKAENADSTLLLDNGVDLHNYQPSAEDMIRISTCDLFVYVGGESDKWVEDALRDASNKDMIVICLLDVLGEAAKEEEIKEGMESSDHEHSHEDDHEDDHDHEAELDEHVWLSMRNAAVFVKEICDALGVLDEENAEVYSANAAAYIRKLMDLDSEYQTRINAAKTKTVLFADRFPFRYLVDDYGLDYFAAFAGCSAETEASFETIAFLAGKVDALGLSAVMTLEGTNHRLAQTVISASQSGAAKILSMDSMQSVTSADIKNGVTYLSIMKNNLSVLAEALK